MQEIRIIQLQLSVDELQNLIKAAVSEEVRHVVSSELNRVLSTPEEDRLISRADAMELLGIKSRSTMISFEKSGRLDPVHFGNRVSYRLQDIQELISKNKRV